MKLKIMKYILTSNILNEDLKKNLNRSIYK